MELTAGAPTSASLEQVAAGYTDELFSSPSVWMEPPLGEPVVIIDNGYPFVGCVFTSNFASQHGGAVMLGAVRIGIGFENCIFQRNIAREYGGAFFAQTSSGSTLVKNGTFVDKYVFASSAASLC